jgi:hypothetical protein
VSVSVSARPRVSARVSHKKKKRKEKNKRLCASRKPSARARRVRPEPRASTHVRHAEKSDLKSSYVDFDPHCASALDFGTIITFLRGGDERERDADAT